MWNLVEMLRGRKPLSSLLGGIIVARFGLTELQLSQRKKKLAEKWVGCVFSGCLLGTASDVQIFGRCPPADSTESGSFELDGRICAGDAGRRSFHRRRKDQPSLGNIHGLYFVP